MLLRHLDEFKGFSFERGVKSENLLLGKKKNLDYLKSKGGTWKMTSDFD